MKLLKKPGLYVSIVVGVCLAYFLFKIYLLGVLPPKFLHLLYAGALGVFLLSFILWIVAKHLIFKIIAGILSLALLVTSVVGSSYIIQTVDSLSSMTTDNLKIKKTISVYALNLSAVSEEKDLENRKIGILKENNRENVDICLSQITVPYEVVEYTSTIQMIHDFKGQAIDCICIDSAYIPSIEEYEEFEEFENDIKAVFEYSYYIAVTDTVDKVEIANEPFTILISGIDTRSGTFNDPDSRSDVNIVVTVNPQTRQIFMLSIPRDYYVETACEAVDGCANGQMDKLTHTGWHGVSTTEMTIEKLLGININYNVRVNFATVTTLVDLLGGIDIYSEIELLSPGNGGHACVINQGWNHVNGQCALDFARERYAYNSGDRQRGKNQMHVMTAIMKKMISPNLLTNFSSIMETMSSLIQTNMDMESMFSIVNKQLDEGGQWTISQYSLDGYGETNYAYELGDYAYTMVPDQTTIDNAYVDIQAVIKGDIPPYVTEQNVVG